MNRKLMSTAAAICLWSGMATAVQAAPSIAMGNLSGQAGTSVQVPLTFNPGGASISALQFNLILPAGVSAGSVATSVDLSAAGKGVTSTQHGKTWTFIIYGPNQNLIKKGPLVTIDMKIAPGTALGPLKIGISGTVYSDPNARSIPAGTSKAGTIQVVAKK